MNKFTSVSVIIFALILYVNLSFSYCIEVSRSMHLPAIIDENKSQTIMVQVQTIQKINSQEQTFLSINPFVGYDTQNSINIASEVARRIVKNKGIDTTNCNILITFESRKRLEYIDGPSAGIGFVTLIAAALQNETIRNDITMTGTINPDLSIGSVGGLALKGEAAYKNGYSIFMTPILSNSEKIELLMLKNYYNLKIVQVSDAEQAYKIATTPENISISENIALSPEKIQEYERIDLQHWYTKNMKEVARNMITNAENLSQFTLPYQANFETRVLNAKNALESNQIYTAANIAFLLLIDEGVSQFNKEKMIEEYFQAKKCINSFEYKNKTDKNFEIIGPAEARYFWSLIKLNETISDESIFDRIMSSMPTGNKIPQNEFITPLFSKYKEILNAKYWCFAANDMAKYSNHDLAQNEIKVNELVMKKYTEQIISELEAKTDKNNSDAVFHIKTARLAMENGKYTAALVDAAYIKSHIDLIDILEMSENEIEEKLESLLMKNYTFIWPEMFKNHAKIIAEENKYSAIRVALIADNMEQYFTEGKSLLKNNLNNELNKEKNQIINRPNEELRQKAEEMLAYQALAIITIIGSIIFIVYILIKINLIGKRKQINWKIKKKK